MSDIPDPLTGAPTGPLGSGAGDGAQPSMPVGACDAPAAPAPDAAAVDARLQELEKADPRFNPHELVADVREAFGHLESAISTANPAEAQPFVSAHLYDATAALVRDLQARGHRRIHGNFDIVGVEITGVDSPGRIHLRVHAASSLLEVDVHQAPVIGSADLMAWSQDLVAVPGPTPAHGWILDELGVMTVAGPVSGPAGTPADPDHSIAEELVQRSRDERSDEEHDALLESAANLLNMRYNSFWNRYRRW